AKQEAHVEPSVAPTAQIRRASAAVRQQRSGNSGEAPSRERGLDHQLARELHPPGPQVKRPDGVAVKAAQAAMEVADRRAEQQAPYEAEHRVAEIAMQQRHGALADAALEPVAHDQGVAFAQPCNKALQDRKSVV